MNYTRPEWLDGNRKWNQDRKLSRIADAITEVIRFFIPVGIIVISLMGYWHIGVLLGILWVMGYVKAVLQAIEDGNGSL